MDLFTHVIFAYLLSFVIWGPHNPQYIAAGALAGGIPDADALLFPLARRFEMLSHHGITHSIVGVTATSAVGSFLLPYLPYFPHASTFLYFIAMMIGGLSHVFLDGFTHFAVSPLLPFSWREFRLDADVAINIIMLAITSVTLVTLSLERGTVPFNIWIETAWILTGIYGAYLVMRGLARWEAAKVRDKEGFSSVTPTTSPLVWMLLDKKDTPERYTVRFRRMKLGESSPSPESRMEIRKIGKTSGPVNSTQEALERTYQAAMDKNSWLAIRPHAGKAVQRGDEFEVMWYIVEHMGFGRTLGVHGMINRNTGEMRLRSGFFRLPRNSDVKV